MSKGINALLNLKDLAYSNYSFKFIDLLPINPPLTIRKFYDIFQFIHDQY